MKRCLLTALLAVSLLAVAAEGHPPPPAWARDHSDATARHWYRKYLRREPAPAEFRAWANMLRNGEHPANTLAAILGSPEYYQVAGGSNPAFVVRVYTDIAGRRPTPDELNYWAGQLLVTGRDELAYALVVQHPATWDVGAAVRPLDDHLYDFRPPVYRRR